MLTGVWLQKAALCFMSLRPCARLFIGVCVERFAVVIVPQQGHGCGGMSQPGLLVVNV